MCDAMKCVEVTSLSAEFERETNVKDDHCCLLTILAVQSCLAGSVREHLTTQQLQRKQRA